MKDKLENILKFLNVEELKKEIVELDYNDEIRKIVGDNKITFKITGKTKHVYLSGIGDMDNYLGKIDVVYNNKKGHFIIKPILIQEYLDSL